jgi:hypothetical protein
MGEAKRRQAAEGAPAEYRDIRTGETKIGRQAGKPRQFAFKYLALNKAGGRRPGHRGAGAVQRVHGMLLQEGRYRSRERAPR